MNAFKRMLALMKAEQPPVPETSIYGYFARGGVVEVVDVPTAPRFLKVRRLSGDYREPELFYAPRVIWHAIQKIAEVKKWQHPNSLIGLQIKNLSNKPVSSRWEVSATT